MDYLGNSPDLNVSGDITVDGSASLQHLDIQSGTIGKTNFTEDNELISKGYVDDAIDTFVGSGITPDISALQDKTQNITRNDTTTLIEGNFRMFSGTGLPFDTTSISHDVIDGSKATNVSVTGALVLSPFLNSVLVKDRDDATMWSVNEAEMNCSNMNIKTGGSMSAPQIDFVKSNGTKVGEISLYNSSNRVNLDGVNELKLSSSAGNVAIQANSSGGDVTIQGGGNIIVNGQTPNQLIRLQTGGTPRIEIAGNQLNIKNCAGGIFIVNPITMSNADITNIRDLSVNRNLTVNGRDIFVDFDTHVADTTVHFTEEYINETILDPLNTKTQHITADTAYTQFDGAEVKMFQQTTYNDFPLSPLTANDSHPPITPSSSTVESENSNTIAFRAFDRDLATHWTDDASNSVDPLVPQPTFVDGADYGLVWLQIDAGKDMTFDTMKFAIGQTTNVTFRARTPRKFKICATSDNGATWYSVLHEEAATIEDSEKWELDITYPNTVFYNHTFSPPVTTRYLRVAFEENNADLFPLESQRFPGDILITNWELTTIDTTGITFTPEVIKADVTNQMDIGSFLQTFRDAYFTGTVYSTTMFSSELHLEEEDPAEVPPNTLYVSSEDHMLHFNDHKFDLEDVFERLQNAEGTIGSNLAKIQHITSVDVDEVEEKNNSTYFYGNVYASKQIKGNSISMSRGTSGSFSTMTIDDDDEVTLDGVKILAAARARIETLESQVATLQSQVATLVSMITYDDVNERINAAYPIAVVN
jgi:hypothetical protein